MTGSGTLLDPYVIWNVNDLQDIALDLTAYYELGQDIDASATVGWNAGQGFVPIGFTGSFIGHLDGKYHKVTGLHINRPAESYQGLFENLRDGGTIQDVGVEQAYVRAKADSAVLVSYVQDTIGTALAAMLSGCWVKDSEVVVLDGYGAGLFWWAERPTADHIIAEVCLVNNVVIHDEGNSDGWLGGFCSTPDEGLIRYCYALDVDVHCEDPNTGLAQSCGGFAANVQGNNAIGTACIIRQCFATGSVVCKEWAGGFAGEIGYNACSIVEDCYTRANVHCFGDAPGAATSAGFCPMIFAGTVLGFGGRIYRSYSTGLVTTSGGGGAGQFLEVVGFGWINIGIGFPDSIIDDCNTDMDVNGCATPGDAMGNTTVQMKSAATFPAWDFVAIWNINPLCNDGYPCLLITTPGCPSTSSVKRQHYAFARAEL